MKPKLLNVNDDLQDYYHPDREPTSLSVFDHTVTDTGLLDKDGNPILRGPNPIGYVWNMRSRVAREH